MRPRAAPARSTLSYCLWLSLWLCPTLPGAAADLQDIAVSVHKSGALVEVDVDFRVAAAPEEVWRVMTDYDHMDKIVSNVMSSRVIARHDDRIDVALTTRLKLGPWSFKVTNVREIRLSPVREIRSTVVSGDMLSSEFMTTLSPDGSGTRVVHHGVVKPDRWIPPIVGPAMIESETRKQYGEMRDEVMRRGHHGVP